jgi:proline dehydrogenase
MLRSLFVGLSKAAWARRLLTSWAFARRASQRFVAGETIEEAVDVVRQLNLRKINATLDHLGENTSSPEEARASADEVVALLRAIHRSGLRSNVSVKLSQIGLLQSPDLCRALLAEILQTARELTNFVRIDMEDSSLTESTLEMYAWAIDQGFGPNVGIVLQSYLFRTAGDLERVLALGGRVRLCKGAYREADEIAFARKNDVNRSFDELAERLLRASQPAIAPRLSTNGRVPPVPALATHDPARIAHARRLVSELKMDKNGLEFQMLHGIRRDLQEELVRRGYPVRVYVPYGTHWYPYFMRRLGERPANVWFFISNFFRH